MADKDSLALSGEAAPATLCPACGSGDMQMFYRVDAVPTNSCILLPTPEEASSYPRGDITLGFCPECGFISNTAFDQKLTEYSGRYEETQGFSGTFNSFHKRLAEQLIEKHDLRGKEVLEIGCGKGEFITLLSELGDNRGLGFDPGYHDDRNPSQAAAGKVKFIKDFYSEKYSQHQADFVCCKMTLEHIPSTGSFIDTVRRAIGDRHDTIVFFQIPEVLRILRDCAFEDIYYEHCSYFSPGSLARLFRKAGFEVLGLYTEYDGQYLAIEARPADDKDRVLPQLADENDLDELKDLVSTFQDRVDAKLKSWSEKLGGFTADDKKVVLWGSGSKGVSFLKSVEGSESIEYVVDINPYRQGHYMSGTAQKIVAPEFLKDYRPDAVVIMNAIYEEEISKQLSLMGLNPKILAL
jgi:SAM-dependent methyltransferase